MSISPGMTKFKDPDAELVYTWDIAQWLVSPAQVASATFTITPPANEAVSALTKDNESTTATTASLRLLGGTLGKTYTVTCEWTTNETPTQTDNASIKVAIVNL